MTVLESGPLVACRICDGQDLYELLDLGVMASCGNFSTSPEDDMNAPMNLVRCRDCGLVQMGHSYNMPAFFGDGYGYRSGLNASMVSHLKTVVEAAQSIRPLKDGDIVLDIGANDGTLLKFYGDNLRRIGMDPTIRTFEEHYPEDIVRIADFFSAGNWLREIGQEQARIITSIAMFYDIERPVEFAREIASILADDGIWVFEQSYLPLMLERHSFDTICHEHLEYYTLAQVEKILAEAGMRVVVVDVNNINGGSFRVTATLEGSPIQAVDAKSLAAFRDNDKVFNDNFDAIFGGFQENLHNLKASLMKTMSNLLAQGKTVHGYGASTKGNTLLQLYGIDVSKVPMIADVNERKWGSMTPGTHIPIVSEEESKSHRPDFYLVLPWHFRDFILEREKPFIEAGGGFIFPLPKIEVVDAGGSRLV